jgi:hypothetical protein
MSDLENAVKPLILPLILGRGKQLHPAGQTTIATWALLKAAVADHVGEGPKAVLAEHRHALYESRGKTGVPEHVRVWIARYAGTRYPALSTVRHMGFALTDPRGDTAHYDGYHVTFSIEHLVIVVFGHAPTPIPVHLELSRGLNAALHAVWPTQESFTFPSRPALTDAGLRRLSHQGAREGRTPP